MRGEYHMKKITLLLAIILIIASISLSLFACTSKVADKTYEATYYSITTKGLSNKVIGDAGGEYEAAFKDAEITFTADGKIVRKKGDAETTIGYYKQDGKNIYVSETEEVKTDGDPDITIKKNDLYWTITVTVDSQEVTVLVKLSPKS